MNEITYAKDITDKFIHAYARGREFELKVIKSGDGRQIVSIIERDGNVIWFSTVLDSNDELHIHLIVKGGE